MENRSSTVSPLYLLERFEPGIVNLDAERRVIGMNAFARRVLPVDEKQPFDRMVLDFHPPRSRAKVEFLLDQARQCPVAAPPPMTMIINIPERVLLIKVSRMTDAALQPTGYTLVFYDITDIVAAKEETQPARTDARRRLLKIPTVSNQRIVFVDADDILAIQSEGHYTRVLTAQGNQFCNLSIGDIETRLDPEHFMRVHRGHVINLRAVHQLQRESGRLAVQLNGIAEPVPVARNSSAQLLERLGVPSIGAIAAFANA
jgi:LytTR family transcriptional regulator, CO-responsive transcriptional regulator RcoM